MFFVFVGGSDFVPASLLAAARQHGCISPVFLCVVGCGPRSCASGAGRH